jgi:hypothetical protein
MMRQFMRLIGVVMILSACCPMDTKLTETLFSCGSSTTVKTCSLRASTNDLLEMVDIPAEYVVKSLPIPSGLATTWSKPDVGIVPVRQVIINLVITDANGTVQEKFSPSLTLRITTDSSKQSLVLLKHGYASGKSSVLKA